MPLFLWGNRNICKVMAVIRGDVHSDDILGARMLIWKPKEARILKNFIDQPI
jgi:hypothetical protein